eukprot:1523798-Rhodomonas_salina.6
MKREGRVVRTDATWNSAAARFAPSLLSPTSTWTMLSVQPSDTATETPATTVSRFVGLSQCRSTRHLRKAYSVFTRSAGVVVSTFSVAFRTACGAAAVSSVCSHLHTRNPMTMRSGGHIRPSNKRGR